MSVLIHDQVYLRRNNGRIFVRDHRGGLHVVYTYHNNGDWVGHKVSYDNGATWSDEDTLTSDNGAQIADVAVKSDGTLCVAIGTYVSGYSGTVKYVEFNHSWGSVEILGLNNFAYQHVFISVDSDDGVSVAAREKVGAYTYRFEYRHKPKGGSWSSWTQFFSYSDPSSVGKDGHLYAFEYGPDNKLFAMWNYRDSSSAIYQAYCKRFDGSSWQATEQLSNVSGLFDAVDASGVWDDSGDIYAVWYEHDTSHFYIKYRKFDGTTWGSEVTITTSGQDPAISISLDGHVHVFYKDGNVLRHAEYDGSSWTIASLLTTGVEYSKPLCHYYPRISSYHIGIPLTDFELVYSYDMHLYYYTPSSHPDWAKFSFIACCNYNGQFLIGGITAVGVAAKYSQWKLNTVAWSQIGRWNLDYGSEVSKTAGFRHMTFGGTVLKLQKLGNRVVVHGTNGMAFMKHFSEPIPGGWGLEELDMPGIASGFHCAGNDSVYGFIDFNNYWWTVTADGKFTKWGYKEFIESLSGTIKVSYLPSKQRFYITDGSTCYMFSQYGMCSIGQIVRSAGVYGGNECASAVDGSDLDFRVVSDMMDYGTRGLKTLTTMETSVDTESGAVVKLAVDYKYDKTASFVRSDWVQTNKRGGVGIMKTALEFRLGVLIPAVFSAPPEVNLDYILTTIQISDRSMIRGVYAQQGGEEDVASDNA